VIQPFTARVADALDRIYQIVGPVSRVDALDIAPPILVHDISREAELSAGFFVEANLTLGPTDGAGTVAFASKTRNVFLADTIPAQLLSERGLTLNDVDVWIIGYYAIILAADTGDFGHLRIGVRIGTTVGSGQSRQLALYSGVEAQPLVSGGVHFLNTGSGAGSFQGNGYGDWLLPIFMADDSDSAFLLEGADDAGGAMTCSGFWPCWVGPKGAPCPIG
jgi:hypothetical protein